MGTRDRLGAIEIGDRARELQHAMEAARAQREAIGGFPDQGRSGAVELCDILDDRGGRRRICHDILQTKRFITGALQRAGGRDPRRNLARALGGRRQHEIRRGDRRRLDLEIETIEQRPRQARLLLRHAAFIGLTPARKAGIARMAATTGVHRRDELETRGIDSPVVGARNTDLAGLQRLAEAVQNLRLKLRQFVEKQNAIMGE